MANPIIPQGVLNRLRGSVVFDANPQLNITAPFLGEEGINITLEGEVTDNYGTMTGTVTSAAPYQMAVIEVELLKTQGFSNIWKTQIELNSVIGDFTVIPDAASLGNFIIINGNITNAQPGRLNGKNVGYVLTLRGFYPINSSLYTG